MLNEFKPIHYAETINFDLCTRPISTEFFTHLIEKNIVRVDSAGFSNYPHTI